MYTKAYFKNIDVVIQNYLKEARSSIHVAVAWFTDTNIFNLLLELSKKGVNIQIIIVDDEINETSGIDFSLLEVNCGSVYKMSPVYSSLMHNKFCIIDDNLVINGSYNWTNKAKYNHESIIVFKDNPLLVQDFTEEFVNLKRQINGVAFDSETNDLSRIIRRLEAIKSLLLIEDMDSLRVQIQKLKKDSLNEEEALDLANYIESKFYNGEFYSLTNSIDAFLSLKISIKVYQDPEIHSLKIELNFLKNHLQTLEDEKSEIHKLIVLFRSRYNEILSPIIVKILELKVKMAEDDIEKEKSESEYKKYNEDIDESNKNKPAVLTDDEIVELKQKFKQACKLCHPDLVAEQYREEASRTFILLKEAYDLNNISVVNQILDNLKNGLFSKPDSSKDDKRLFLREIQRIKSSIKKVELEIQEITQTEIYMTILNAGNWDEYFESKIKELNEYYNKLKNGITKK